jgi:hypothetical protein
MTVLAEGAAPPPVAVVDAPLSSVRTIRGLALGLTMAQVRRLYGPAAASQVRGIADITVLSYRHVILEPCEQCEQDVDVAFSHDRAVYIAIYDGC